MLITGSNVVYCNLSKTLPKGKDTTTTKKVIGMKFEVPNLTDL